MKITLFLLILTAFLNAQILDVKILYLEQKIQKPPMQIGVIRMVTNTQIR